MNASVQHTPGPWNSTDDHRGVLEVLSNDGTMLAQVWRYGAGSNELPGESNARLIAASPELLSALEFIVNDCKPGEDAQLTTEGYNRACAAIEKAKGGAS